MALVKQIKNVSGGELTVRGVVLQNNEVHTILDLLEAEWLTDPIPVAWIDSGDLEVGDGTNWYTGDDAIAYFFANIIKTGKLILEQPEVPTSKTADGIPGQIAWDSNYFYICVASDTWKRVAIDNTLWL